MRRVVASLLFAVSALGSVAVAIAAVGALIAAQHFRSEPEDTYGWVLTGSLALAVTLVAFAGARLARRPPNVRRT